MAEPKKYKSNGKYKGLETPLMLYDRKIFSGSSFKAAKKLFKWIKVYMILYLNKIGNANRSLPLVHLEMKVRMCQKLESVIVWLLT